MKTKAQHLVKHPISKTKHLRKCIEPTVEEGEESKEQNQHSCKEESK